jgi:hypothetical protein
VEVVFKLAQKYEDRYSMPDKVKELYEKVIALDPKGTAGKADLEYPKARVAYTEYAEYALAGQVLGTRTPDKKPMEDFLAKYPGSELQKSAYSQLARYYRSSASKEEAAAFFETYTAKYPEDPRVLTSYVQRIIRDQEPLDKGIELAEKVNSIIGYPPNASYTQNLAQLHVLKGDKAKAEEEYGKDFADTLMSSTTSSLLAYANFWVSQNTNLESAEKAADTAAELSPETGYYLQQAAAVYTRLNKPEKALAVFGPEFAKRNWAEEGNLSGYAAYWNREGKNLESAAEAALRAVELSPDYYNHFVLGQILFKQKRYPEALKAAETAVELVKVVAAKYEGYPITQYENLVKEIKGSMGR